MTNRQYRRWRVSGLVNEYVAFRIEAQVQDQWPSSETPQGERGFALVTGRWRTLHHVTASPSKIGDIVRAALVLTHFEHGYIT